MEKHQENNVGGSKRPSPDSAQANSARFKRQLPRGAVQKSSIELSSEEEEEEEEKKDKQAAPGVSCARRAVQDSNSEALPEAARARVLAA